MFLLTKSINVEVSDTYKNPNGDDSGVEGLSMVNVI